MSQIADFPLPPTWGWMAIEDVTSYVQRGKSPKYAERSALPVVNQRCVRWHGVQSEHLKFIDESQWSAWGPERTLQDGDVLWNSTGTGTIGRAAIYRALPGYKRVVADSHVTILRARDVLPEYLHAWIRSPSVQRRIDAMQVGSTNQVELGRGEVLRTRIPVAPPNEQRRIVAKLEALQARSRRAGEALDAVPPLLEKLRQSILAAAFRGDLTKDWRATHESTEPGAELLKRIRTERRKTWEAYELAKMLAKGKAPTNDGWKARYVEPAPADAAGLPALASGWCWASFDELAYDSLYGPRFAAEQYAAEGLPTLRTTDLNDEGVVVWNSPPRVRVSDAEYVAVGLRPHDLVVTRTGATIGKCALYREGDERALPSAYLIRFGLVSDTVDPEYVLQAMLSPSVQTTLRGGATATAQPNVNARTIGRLAIPVAPKREQLQILSCLSSTMGRVAATTAAARSAELTLAALNSATLAKAFRGELVPQNPKDEPAEAVLQRNSASRGPAYGPSPKRGRGRTATRAV